MNTSSVMDNRPTTQPAANQDEVLLIDLSSIAHPIWHASGTEPDPNFVSNAIVSRVRALATGHRYAAVCCDSGKSFRHELSADYKANRPVDENRAVLHHQIARAVDVLKGDGFPIWSVPGAEADDLIGTATRRTLAVDGLTVLVASADKDLLQLVGPRVTAQNTQTGNRVDAEGVFAKFGVTPDQIVDYLSLVGDASDNVKGAKGIGEKRAAELLANFNSLPKLFAALDTPATSRLTPSIVTSLREFQTRADLTRQLITLKTDVEIPFDDILQDRKPATTTSFSEAEEADEMAEAMPTLAPPAAAPVAPPTTAPKKDAMAVRDPEVLAAAPSDWKMQLEPRSMSESWKLSQAMFDSRLFSAYGTPHAVLSTIMAGRELGMQAMASLRAFHIIDNKPTLPADLIRALVIRSGEAQYFRCTERTNERATFVTKRGSDPEIALTYTLDEGRKAWPKDQASFDKSGWGRNPADMCVARASAKLARLVYADVIHGIYSPEELD